MDKNCTNCAFSGVDPWQEPCVGCQFYDDDASAPTQWRAGTDESVGALHADRRRLEWLLTVMSLDCDPANVGGPRTAALGAALMLGKTGRDAIDYAMEGSP